MTIDASTGIQTATLPVSTGGNIRATVGALTADLSLGIVAAGAWEAQNTVTTAGVSYGLAASGTTVHVVKDTASGLTYFRSTNSGSSFASGVVLDAVASSTPYLDTPVCCIGSKVYVAYTRASSTVDPPWGPTSSISVGENYVVTSLDDGVTWGTPVLVSSGGKSFRHSIAASESRVFLCWMDYRNGLPDDGPFDLRYVWSINSGTSFSADTLLVAGQNQMGAQRPSVDLYPSGGLVIAWLDGRDGNAGTTIEGGTTIPESTEIYFKRGSFVDGDPGGPLWVADQRLTVGPTTYSGRPFLKALTGGTLLLVYDQRISGANNIVVSQYSEDGGETWSTAQTIADPSGVATHPYIAKDALIEGRAYVAYMDQTSGTIIKMRITNDGGRTFSVEQQASTAGVDAVPIIGCTTGYLNGLWQIGGNLVHRRFAKPAL